MCRRCAPCDHATVHPEPEWTGDENRDLPSCARATRNILQKIKLSGIYFCINDALDFTHNLLDIIQQSGGNFSQWKGFFRGMHMRHPPPLPAKPEPKRCIPGRAQPRK